MTKEEKAEYNRNYQKTHKDQIREQRKAHYNEHKAENAERCKHYQETHREERLEYHRRYNEEHREEAKAYKQTHREETNRAARSRRQSHPELFREKSRIHRQLLKLDVLTHYGNGKAACVRCGFDDIRALSIDHVHGDGAAHRKAIQTQHLYLWLKRNKFPEGFQTLCLNCQFIKRIENNELPRGRWGGDSSPRIKEQVHQ